MPSQKFVKDFKGILKDMEPFVKSVKPLWNGRDFENFTLRAREIWSLWLLCVALHKMHHGAITFGEDKEADGIIKDLAANESITVENVAAMDWPGGKPLPKGEQRIIDAIEKKISLGEQYGKNKILVVFFDGAGLWHRNKVREAINGRYSFEAIYLVGLITDNAGKQYSYSVTELYEDDSRTVRVDIAPDFSDWSVTEIQ